MVIYHGSKERVTKPKLRATRYNKGFYFGFYCALLPEQAKRWAVRITGSGSINRYEYTEDASLKVKQFPEMTEEWLDFIDGNISRAAFWELAKFRNPTHQIRIHTARALNAIRFIEAVEVRDEE